MPNLPTIVALMNAAKRRRTPRMVKASVDVSPGGTINVLFDRVMDNVPSGGGVSTDVRGVFRYFDGVNGDIITFGEDPGSGWSDERNFSSFESSRTSGYVGPSYCVYLRGNLKARGRFFVDNYARTDNTEII